MFDAKIVVMICINLASTNPYFNLAAEEYLLKNYTDDVLMIWQSVPSVIVGKHQNMMAEINYPYILKNGIPVIRRLSGGGTVFHDLGNVNFTYIANGKEGHIVDFKRFTQPIVDFLNSYKVPAVLSGRNDILVDGLKFSGNAEHVYKQRVLHHGTILFSSNLEMLKQGITRVGGVYSDSSVKSFRSKVANLAPYFRPQIDVDTFRSLLFSYLKERHFSDSHFFSDVEMVQIQRLADEKYSTWEWNFGYSPDYSFNSGDDSLMKIHFFVKKGRIDDIKISSSDANFSDVIIESLRGLAHDDFKSISQILVANCNDSLKESDIIADWIY